MDASQKDQIIYSYIAIYVATIIANCFVERIVSAALAVVITYVCFLQYVVNKFLV